MNTRLGGVTGTAPRRPDRDRRPVDVHWAAFLQGRSGADLRSGRITSPLVPRKK